jgi:hypothetical protein
MRRSDPIPLRFHTARGKSHTVIGAISSAWKDMKYMVTDKTNTKTVLSFLKQITGFIESIKDTPTDYVLVLDNHSAHKSHLVRDFALAKGFKLLFTPPTMSELNSIEHVSHYHGTSLSFDPFIHRCGPTSRWNGGGGYGTSRTTSTCRTPTSILHSV